MRLNRNRIRQAGAVSVAGLGLNLIDGGKQAEAVCDLTGDPEQDLARARRLLVRLRERLAFMPEDPYLSYSTEASEGQSLVGGDLPPAEEAIATLIEAAEGLDLVGIWASGEIQEGLASSIGHRRWHRSRSFNLDWSGYLGDRQGAQGQLQRLRLEPGAAALKTPRHARWT